MISSEFWETEGVGNWWKSNCTSRTQPWCNEYHILYLNQFYFILWKSDLWTSLISRKAIFSKRSLPLPFITTAHDYKVSGWGYKIGPLCLCVHLCVCLLVSSLTGELCDVRTTYWIFWLVFFLQWCECKEGTTREERQRSGVFITYEIMSHKRGEGVTKT